MGINFSNWMEDGRNGAIKRRGNHASNNPKRRKLSDSFTEMINSMGVVIVDESEFLDFRGVCHVYQYPESKIYIRRCYKDMYKDIQNYLLVYNNIRITGQPGIGKTSFIYFLLYKLMTNPDWQSKYNCVYIVKGKKYGRVDEIDIYKVINGFSGYYLSKCSIGPSDINDAIIIVETCNIIFEGNKIMVISISSPDEQNNSEYKNKVELYFESFNFDEIQKWFKNCIGFDSVDVGSKEFKRSCEIYGNIPRLVYFHYLYKMNYGIDYLEYYEKLIDSVVGFEGYNIFLKKYVSRKYLEENPLLNIILKYDLVKKQDRFLENKTYKPKQHLKFISKFVEDYITYKFFPPTTAKEHRKLIDNYNKIHDNNMKSLAFKHITAYELAREMIIIEGKDENFVFNSEKKKSIYYPDGSKNIVYIILDKKNYFDFIMNGVFIKIQYNVNDDKKKLKMKESIREYSEVKNGTFLYTTIYENITYKNPPILELIIEEEDDDSEGGEEEENEGDEEEEGKIKAYAKNKEDIYLMRNCYYEMLKIICPGGIIDISYPYQKNYLIFGHKKIGKSILAAVIKEYIHQMNLNIEIKYISDKEKREKKYYYNTNEQYIVISDGEIIEGDGYPDAKMIILLADPTDKKYKTFQSKRCPLVMYIPPFTKEEIEKVIILEDPKYKLYRNYPNYFMNKYDLDLHVRKMAGLHKKLMETSTTSDFNSYIEKSIGDIDSYIQKKIPDFNSYLKKNINDIKLFIQKKIQNTGSLHIYNTTVNKYRKNYEFYGGIIGNRDYDKSAMKSLLKYIISDKKVREMILIYETFEDDVTKSDDLTFISETIQDMVNSTLIKINSKEKCKKMIDLLLKFTNRNVVG